ncbi:MAG: PH domain-containing protein, partial [Deltaproteobacteria bacterium]|nr:PH domain-containing protein [Deltaproteobacteria bacterium]
PYLWATTRYRVGRAELRLYAGVMSVTLELGRIERVTRARQGVGLSFAFHTDTLWIAYPSRLHGYLVSPREKELFLELLDQRCAHLEMRDGELLPCSELDVRSASKSETA